MAPPGEPLWLGSDAVVAINAQVIAVFGGRSATVRDENLLQAAMGRPLNKWHYDTGWPSLFDLAAAYCFALARGHVFHDGNKRTAFVAALTFLRRNGSTCDPDSVEAVQMMDAAVSGAADESMLADWFKMNTAVSPV